MKRQNNEESEKEREKVKEELQSKCVKERKNERDGKMSETEFYYKRDRERQERQRGVRNIDKRAILREKYEFYFYPFSSFAALQSQSNHGLLFW